MQNYHFTINFQEEKRIIHFLAYMPGPATSSSDVQWNVSHCPTQKRNRAHGLHLSPDCLASVWYSTSSLESFAASFSFIVVAHYQRWPWPSLAVTSGWLKTIHLLVSHHVWTLSLQVWRGVHHPTPLTGLVALLQEWLQVCPKEKKHFLHWRLRCSCITDLQEYKCDSGAFEYWSVCENPQTKVD